MDKNYYPNVPRCFSQFYCLGCSVQGERSPIPLPPELERVGPSSSVNSIVFTTTRLINAVSERKLEVKEGGKEVIKFELGKHYEPIAHELRPPEFKRFVGSQIGLVGSELRAKGSTKLSGRALAGLADSLLGFVGFEKLTISDVNEYVSEKYPELGELRGKRFKELVLKTFTTQKILRDVTYLLDTNTAYLGVHNEIFEALIELNLMHSRRFTMPIVRNNFCYIDVSKYEVSSKLLDFKVEHALKITYSWSTTSFSSC